MSVHGIKTELDTLHTSYRYNSWVDFQSMTRWLIELSWNLTTNRAPTVLLVVQEKENMFPRFHFCDSLYGSRASFNVGGVRKHGNTTVKGHLIMIAAGPSWRSPTNQRRMKKRRRIFQMPVLPHQTGFLTMHCLQILFKG